MGAIKAIAVVGGGVIGAGWIARFLENGIDVAAFDPAQDSKEKIEAVLSNANAAYEKLLIAPRPKRGKFRFCERLEDAVSGVELVVEAVPEVLTIKQSVYKDIESVVADNVIIASSTSGILPSDLQANMKCPSRLIVAHPFNPVYLLPLVEIVGGEKTSKQVVTAALDFYQAIGMKPLHIKKEIEAFVADRLLEAVWREALWLVNDGIASTEEIDDAIRFGFGLRWAQMGLFETYRLAGGEAGMKHFIAQFGPALKWPWTKLMDVPELTEDLIDTIATQSDDQSGHYSFRQLERIRDDNLIAILQALKINDWGAGNTLAAYEKNLFDTNKASLSDGEDFSKPLLTLQRTIPPNWTDYNNHMTESRYLHCFGEASDTILGILGVDAAYIENEGSYFTVETHIRHLEEVTALESIEVTTQVLAGEGKKLQLFHSLYHSDGRLLATAEQLLLHVNMKTRSASLPNPNVSARLKKIVEAHRKLELPQGVGRAVGDGL